jgi:hypothetical protein
MKITPTYKQIAKSLAFSENLWGKWYCVYFEESGGKRFSRYMSPTGWQNTAYYFGEKREAQLAFGQHGWKSLAVTQEEIQNQKSMDESMREMGDAYYSFGYGTERDELY